MTGENVATKLGLLSKALRTLGRHRANVGTNRDGTVSAVAASLDESISNLFGKHDVASFVFPLLHSRDDLTRVTAAEALFQLARFRLVLTAHRQLMRCVPQIDEYLKAFFEPAAAIAAVSPTRSISAEAAPAAGWDAQSGTGFFFGTASPNATNNTGEGASSLFGSVFGGGNGAPLAASSLARAATSPPRAAPSDPRFTLSRPAAGFVFARLAQLADALMTGDDARYVLTPAAAVAVTPAAAPAARCRGNLDTFANTDADADVDADADAQEAEPAATSRPLYANAPPSNPLGAHRVDPPHNPSASFY